MGAKRRGLLRSKKRSQRKLSAFKELDTSTSAYSACPWARSRQSRRSSSKESDMQGVQEMSQILLKIALVGVVGLLGMERTRMTAAQNASPCDGAALPTVVTELLKEKFPQWRPKQVSDIDVDNRQLWL